jgi:hypothetical protein
MVPQNSDVPTIDIRNLTAEQWNGTACVRCGSNRGPFQPITLIIGVNSVIHYPDQCHEPKSNSEVSAA